MSTVIIPGRAAKGLRPTGNFQLNAGSWQAMGLVAWYPMLPWLTSFYRSPRGAIFTNTAVTVASAAGLGGTCGSFNGSTSILVKAVDTQDVTAPPFSVCSWYYPTSTPANQELWTSLATTFQGWYLQDNNGNLRFDAYDGSADGIATTTTTHVTNAWNLGVGVTSAANSRAAYLNGGGKGTDSSTRTVTQGAGVFEAIGGRDVGGGTGQFFTGLIADTRIYNRVLSDLEVAMLYDPGTRWDLYWQPSRRLYVRVPSSAMAGTVIGDWGGQGAYAE